MQPSVVEITTKSTRVQYEQHKRVEQSCAHKSVYGFVYKIIKNS